MIQNNRYVDFTDLPDSKVGFEDFPSGDPGYRQETEERHDKSRSPSPEPDKENKKVRFKELIDGTFLVRDNMIRQLPYVLFLTLLGVIYIGNRFYAERMVRQISELKSDVGNLRSEQITITAELMNISRPSEVAAMVELKNLGLKESIVPPKKLKRR
jgi:hypothetical protein